ncbi:MAG: right-handed parallel beta-helix repeat-containing protein [Flavobacteriales bacterium]|nr:right-handed parallel beta-helix repeat-containing protein [Flavobacteriales bacterium]
MRYFLLLLAVVIGATVNATVYYVSSTGSDTNNGTSTSTPWKTITRVNQLGSALVAGDQILFQRGGTFRGRLDMTRSGTTANKITVGAYGTGEAPIISGSDPVTNWTVHSGNIWKASVPGTVRMVYFNGAMMTTARYPNTGWLRTDNASSTSLTDAALTQGSGYFTGSRLVIRTTNWSYDTAFVSAQNNTTLTHTSTGNNLGTEQWGYFLTNKLSLLDTPGEWFHDRATGTLYVWCPNNAVPASNTIEASVRDFGVYTSYQRNNILIKDLTIQHQYDCSIRLTGTYNIEITNCTIQDSFRAIYSTGYNQNIHDNTFRRLYQTGVYLLDTGTSITNNNFTDIAIWPGLGEKDWGYIGLRCNAGGLTISNNRFTNIGYIGMVVAGNSLVERNVLENCMMILNDGGCIAFDFADGLIVRENIVRNITGNVESVAPEATVNYPMAHGIYFGNTTIKNTTIERNTSYNCSGSGIHVDHTMVSSGNQIKDNVLFNNLMGISISDYSNYNTPGATPPYHVSSYNTVYSGNIMYSLRKDQFTMQQIHLYAAEMVDFGTFTNNKYFNPFNEMSIEVWNPNATIREVYNLERFKAIYGEDPSATRSPLRQDAYSTASELSGNLVLNGTFASNVTGWGGWPSNAVITRDLTYLDGGALKAYLPNGNLSPQLTMRNPDQFNLQTGQWYRMRFSIQSNALGKLNAGVKGASQLTNANTIFDRDVPFDTERRDVEWYFQGGLTDQAMAQFTNNYTEPTYWLDNVELHRVTVTPVDPLQNHLIYANDQTTAQSYTLPAGCWKNVDGVLQGATITVQPFRSTIVYRVTGAGCNSPTVDCQGVAGGTALPGTACNDNNPCTVNDVWSAGCQCVGTASGLSASITAGGATSFCSGGSVVLSATTGSGYAYVWKRNGTAISGATSASYTATLAGTYTVDVTSNGCTSTASGLVVSVGTAPSATITAGGATTFCSGSSVTFSANTGTGLTYQWRKNGASISGATASTYSATQAGSYSVVVTSSGCSATSSATTVVVNAAPTATLTAGGATGFCTGGSVVLSANTGTGLTYSWRKNGTAISGATASTYTATLAGSYTVVVSSGGCSTTSSIVPVTVNTTPSATITAGGATTFCGGGSVTLTANSGTGYTYQWKKNGTNVSGATAVSYAATAAGSYTVQVSNGGCSTTSAAKTVTVTAAPTAVITAGGSLSFCTGGSVALNATTGSGYAFVWKKNGSTISGATASTYTATTSGTYTVVITSGGCSTTSAGAVVTASSAPTATITAGGSTAFCAGSSVVLNASTGIGLTYQWRKDGVSISGATASTYSATTGGAYSVVVASGSCISTSASTTVSVKPAPTVNCSSSTSSSTVSVTATGGQSPYTYSWNTSPVQTSATASVSVSGTYTATVTGGNGCSASCSTTISLSSSSSNCAGLHTEAQGTWGATATQYNMAGYMSTRWATAFPAPNYLTIGCGTRLMRFTTANSVIARLPTYGMPALLASGTAVDPSSVANTLVGQIVALRINIRMDEMEPTFGAPTGLLKDMTVASGTFAGWTVQQLLDHANQAIGGCVSQYSLASISSAITTLNNGYQAGNMNNGYLLCPSQFRSLEDTSDDAVEVGPGMQTVVYPNPFTTSTTIAFSGLDVFERLTVQVYSVDGRLVDTPFDANVPLDGTLKLEWHAAGRSVGLYHYRATNGTNAVSGKLMVE